MKSSLVPCILFFALSTVAISSPVVDRLVLEINKISYTQRQFESFMALQSALRAGPSEQLILVVEGNWRQLLIQYKDLMIIEQEAMRLSSLQPTAVEIDHYRQIVENRKTSDMIFSSFLTRFDLDPSDIRQVLSSISRVEGYIKGRQGTVKEAFIKQKRLGEAQWFRKLSQRTPFRIYKNAENYQEMSPDALGSQQKLDLDL